MRAGLPLQSVNPVAPPGGLVAIVLVALAPGQQPPKEWKYAAPQQGDYNAVFSVLETGDVDADKVGDVILGRQALNNSVDNMASWQFDGRGMVLCVSGTTGRMLWRCDGPLNFDCPNEFGRVIADVGDIDVDGVRDIAIGIAYIPVGIGDTEFYPSAVRIVSGKDGHELRTHQGSAVAVDGFGVSLTATGDLDGDGRADYAIGACTANLSGSHQPPGSDSVSLYSGKSGGLIAKLEGSKFQSGTSFGRRLVDAGDLNGDGVSDIAVQIDTARDFGGTWCAISGKDRSVLYTLDRKSGRIDSDLLMLDDRTGDGIGDMAALVVDIQAGARQLQVGLFSGKDGALTRVVNLDVPPDYPWVKDLTLAAYDWRPILTRKSAGGAVMLSIVSRTSERLFRIDDQWQATALDVDWSAHAQPPVGWFPGGTNAATASEYFYAKFPGPTGVATIVKRIRL